MRGLQDRHCSAVRPDPVLPQLLTLVFFVMSPPRAMRRLFCAILNSLRKPFSKMFTSFRLYWRHRCTPWLPVKRASTTVSLPSSRCQPMFQLCTYPSFMFGTKSFRLVLNVAANGIRRARWPARTCTGQVRLAEEHAAGAPKSAGCCRVLTRGGLSDALVGAPEADEEVLAFADRGDGVAGAQHRAAFRCRRSCRGCPSFFGTCQATPTEGAHCAGVRVARCRRPLESRGDAGERARLEEIADAGDAPQALVARRASRVPFRFSYAPCFS